MYIDKEIKIMKITLCLLDVSITIYKIRTYRQKLSL